MDSALLTDLKKLAKKHSLERFFFHGFSGVEGEMQDHHHMSLADMARVSKVVIVIAETLIPSKQKKD